MNEILGRVLLLTGANALGDVLGAALPGLSRRQNRQWLVRLTSLAAGMLLAAALISLLPEVLEASPDGLMFVLVGYLAMLVAENLFATHAHEPHPPAAETHAAHPLVGGIAESEPLISGVASWAAILGLSIHATFDGIAVGAAVAISSALGNIVSLALFLHKLPEGFGIASILLAAGRSRRIAWLGGVFLGGLTVAGGLLALTTEAVEPGLTGPLLGFATGTLLYIGATDLIPLSNEARDRWTVLLILAGVALLFVSRWLGSLVGVE